MALKKKKEPTVHECLEGVLGAYEFTVIPEKDSLDEYEKGNLARVVTRFEDSECHEFTYTGRNNEVNYSSKGYLRVNFTVDTIRDLCEMRPAAVTKKPPEMVTGYIHHTDPLIVLLQTHRGSYVRVPKIVGGEHNYTILQVI
jgi:hypothetical protein